MLLGTIALFYYLCFLLLMGLALFVLFRGAQRPAVRPRLRCTFCLLALSLLIWLATLFLETRLAHPAMQLWLGRANFSAVAFAAYFAFRFVQEVAARTPDGGSWVLLAETTLLGVVTLLTPLVDAAEKVEAGHAITTFGPLFPGYLVHVLGYLTAALFLALREQRRTEKRRVRRQLTLIGFGILLTSGVAIVGNALLPYVFGDFRFCDLGTLSTLVFVLAVAYATFLHGLFDLRVVVRETLVYGVLLAFVLGAYSSAVFVLSQYLTAGAETLTQFVVLFLAFSVDPLRRFLEEKTDRLLFGDRETAGQQQKRSAARKRTTATSRLGLALLFPWRRP